MDNLSLVRKQLIKGSTETAHWAVLLTFFVWPFGTFVSSLRFIGKRAFSTVLVLFYFLFGYTYIITGKDQDTYRVSQYFLNAATESFSDLWNKMTNLYELGNKPDIFQDLLQFVVSRFTTDVQVYFAIASLLFAFVLAKIFEDLYKDTQEVKDAGLLVLLLSFFLLLVFAPSRINSFRHYMATAIFIFASCRYLIYGGYQNLILLCITPLIHFAFVAVIPLIVLFKIIGRRYVVYYVLIVLSFVFSGQSKDYIREKLPNLEESALQYHANQYTSDYYLKQVAKLKSQRTVILDRYVYYTSIFFLLLTLYHVRYAKNMDEGTGNLFALSLLIFACVNVFSEMESIANRFGVLYHGFCCAFLIRFYKQTAISPGRILKFVFALVLILNAVIVLRILAQSASVSTLLVLFPLALFSNIDTSILDLIR